MFESIFKNESNEKVIFVRDGLLQDLNAGLPKALDLVTKTGAVVRANFPEIKFNISFVWLLRQNADAVEYLCTRLKDKNAKARGLDCGDYFDPRTSILRAAQKDARRVAEAFINDDLNALKAISKLRGFYIDEGRNFETYLRVGAIEINRNGEAVAAENAAELLAAYCTLSVRPGRETEFYNKMTEYTAAVKNLASLHEDIAKMTLNADDRKQITDLNYQFGRLRLAEDVRVLSESSAGRAVLSFVIAYRKKDLPRFYNRVGIPERADVATVHEITGYLPEATPGLRVKYPGLYKNVDFRGIPYDYPEAVQDLKERIKKDGLRLDADGNEATTRSAWREKPNCSGY